MEQVISLQHGQERPTSNGVAVVHISGILTELGIHNVALHSLLSQNRRLASLGTFQSQRVRILAPVRMKRPSAALGIVESAYRMQTHPLPAD